MKLYEVNAAIAELMAQLDPDPQTGEIIGADEILPQLDALEMQRSDILQYLAKLVLDTRADVVALKAEEKRLKERRQSLERKDDRLMEILDRECAGQKTDCGVATVCYRKTTRVEVDDNEAAYSWLAENNHPDCYHIPAPEISKTEVKKLLQNGEEIPGVTLVQDLSCSLK